jgi:sugar phosphate isomerase/epimerase
MAYTRREFGKAALAGVPALALLDRSLGATVLGQARPNSLVSGVQLGAITYSYRSMPDQSAEATLRYLVDSGISACELMSTPAERFAGMPTPNRGGGRGRGRGGRSQPTPEQRAERQAAQRAAAEATKQWRLGVSMDRYKALRAMYDDAGVTIYAFKLPLTVTMSDEEYEYVFNVAEALGANHVTMELPTDVGLLTRAGEFANKRKIYAAYHTHMQGSMTAFDQAFATSPANMSNIDVGHYVGGTNESPIPFFEKFHDRIVSFHLKDKTRGNNPTGGNRNMPWGEGDTPIVELLQLVRDRRWTMPATIELEYPVPEGSDAVSEVATCLDYCRRALS